MVSKLFFSDDTIIFSRANPMDLRCVKRILEMYEGDFG